MARTKKEQDSTTPEVLGQFKVTKRFRDAKQYGEEWHEKGDYISDLSTERIEVLLKRAWIEQAEGYVPAEEETTNTNEEE